MVGKALPALSGIKTDFNLQLARGNAVLFCFFDYEQRPSRRCITQLTKQAKQLAEKGVTVVTVHASKIDEDKLDQWVKENGVPFMVGMIESGEDKTRFSWGVQSLPWLILTDTEHVVRAEGLGVIDLDDKLKQINGD